MLKDKVIVITGASRGIGKEIARYLVTRGAVVIATGRDEILLAELEKELQEYNSLCTTYVLDVCKEDEVRKTVSVIVAKFDRIDVWVNNAGISYTCPFLETTKEMWEDTLSVNLTGVFLCCRNVVEVMKKQGNGNVINVASMNAIKGDKYYSAYTASKHGVLGLTKALAIEFAMEGIRVNAVCPGVIMTDMMKNAIYEEAMLEKIDMETIKERYMDNIPLQRFATGEDVGRVIAFLSSEDAKYLTGVSIPVSGGEV